MIPYLGLILLLPGCEVCTCQVKPTIAVELGEHGTPLGLRKGTL